MKPIAIALLIAIAVAPIRAEDDAKKVQEALQGEWKIVEGIKEGNPEPKEKVEIAKMVFKGNEITITDGKRKPEVVTFTLDPKANPATIDLQLDKKKGTVKGIYKLEKDKLTICFGLDESERPKEFKSEKDSKTGMLVLERVKK